MNKIKVKVLKEQMLYDPYNIGIMIKRSDKGTVVEVPDTSFWRHKCHEGYLQITGDAKASDVDPWKEITVTQIDAYAHDNDIDLADAKKKSEKTDALEAAGVTPEMV